MTVKAGALEFDIIANNKQINSALDETKKRVQGFSDATVEGGKAIDDVFGITTENIKIQKQVIKDLEDQIKILDKEIKKVGPGRGQSELIAQSNAAKRELEAEKQALITLEAEVNKTENAHVSFRTQLRNLREEMVAMEAAGLRNTAEYRAMQDEAGRLTDAIGDVRQQAAILAHDQAGFQGVISALGGITGAASAAQGAVALFAGENENLQKIMLKVQSLMAITVGLQQVKQMLDKDSAFMIVTVGGLKQWWADVVTKATVAETAETAATTANTAAQTANAGATAAATAAETVNTVATGAQATAATAGTVANIGLAGAFRLVGAAIKSIPVFGWILAGISALIGLYSYFTSKAREAKKAQEELNAKIVEIAVKPIAAITELSYAWDKLGDNLEAKKKFVEDNAEKFKELGVAVNGVKDAENLLVANKDAFIQAQIAKAKAMAATAMAADLAKQAIENQQKLEEAQKTPKVTRYYGGGQFGGGGSYEIDNPKIAKYTEKGKEIDGEIQKLYETAAKSEAEGAKKLTEAGIKGAQDYETGTVGALENVISKKQAALKNISDPTEYKKAAKEIEGLQKNVEKITGKTSGSGGGSKKTEDPYTEMLENRKKQYTQYLKWVNSNDEIIQKAAKTEFAGLLKEGSSYLDYLRKQREQLLAISSRTPEQTKKLSKLNDEIAAETKETVLSQFEKELQKQLNGARSIMEMLNILEERRKKLAGDGSDLDTGKKEILDKQQEDVAKKAEEETKNLLDKYSAYLSEKLEFDVNYLERKRLLTEAMAKATTDEERRIAANALQGLENDRKKYSKSSGNADYDKLLEDYKSYQQKCADISADYDEKIALATEKQNDELVKRLTDAKNKALSSVALDELQKSGAWEKLFGNLDDLTTKQISELIAKIEAQRAQLGIELDPKDLEAILSKLEEAKAEIRSRNPFKALKDAIKDYGKAADDEAKKKSLTAVFESVAGSIDLVKGSFDSVVEGLNSMGLAGDEVTQDLLGDISKMLGSASQLATGIATGNPLSIIQGSIGLISSAFEVFNTRDRKAERAIRKHAEAVKELEGAYKALAWAVDKALGETVYDNQKALINNMREQREHLKAMWEAEADKKKTDWGKVNDYKAQYEELGRQIEDTIAEIAASITQTTAKDLANQLADALVEAYGKGENAAEAFEEVSKKVMQNAVKNALKLQFLEQPLKNAIARLQKDMGFDSEGNGTFDGLTAAEQQRFKNAVASIGANFAEAMKMYEDLFKEVEEAADPTTSLSGAIKGASQESIDLLAGQTNAVRVNQVESIELLRQQLLHLASIDAKIGASNKHLQQIEQNTKTSTSDPLRAQGLI